MFLKRLMVLALISLLVGWGTSSTTAETLFFDDFEDGTISKAFKLDATQGSPGKPEWVEKNGILSQTSDKQGDPAYAVIVDKISKRECVELLKSSPVTAYRYLKSLEEKGVISKRGRGKNIHYVLT